ncbi:endonuclease V-like [Paramacrobiotus metropolitanus]|uniref:endonuclease V-like n=1 Tax=Paramacrobiotus metropolitanus TaxID=2943436 RepID=UPI00244621C6|nr:endonuclease V-like [Paramacrobiotus metropolitanus]XP_055335666.1 endonuclease V-like [Paramacrobiotus metropolitanus]XP_055335667.1 endonuclease V-like [Paramacrobiotus metropolitanus]
MEALESDLQYRLRCIKREQKLLQELVRTTNAHFWQRTRTIGPVKSGNDRDTSLQYIGGLDLACAKDNQNRACGALVVLSVPDLKVVYTDTLIEDLNTPYIPGFLGAREYPLMGKLLDRLRENAPEYLPQVLLIDGNGVLHTRRCGSACYVGVNQRIPTIGVGKTLFHMPSWDQSFEREINNTVRKYGDEMDLIDQNETVGKAVIASRTSTKPIFVSVGHDIDLETAVWVVQLCTKFRIPEPIRKADFLSRRTIEASRVI